MEIEIQALAHGKYNRFLGRLITGGSGKRYHGFQCGDGRIIERPAPCDKQSSNGKEFSLRKIKQKVFRGAESGPRLSVAYCVCTAAPRAGTPLLNSAFETHIVPIPRPAYRFRHRTRWNVPGCGRRRLLRSLEQPYQFGLLRQESIVAMGARHLPVIRLDPGGTNCLGKLANLLGWEEPV